jgi:endo-1,4-beta-xylanase
MKTRHPTQGVLVATIVGIAAMGCGKSAGLGTGSGGVANPGGTTASGGGGQGGSSNAPIGAGGDALGGTPSLGGQTGVGGRSSGAGGTTGSGGQSGTGGYLGAGGSTSGGSTSAGGTIASGGTVETAGRIGAGGTSAAGGTVSRDGGTPDVPGGTGGAGSGGTMGAGGARGGTSGTTVGMGGSLGTGGTATGGSSTGTGTVTIDCNAAMPSNGVQHSGNTQGTMGNLAWNLWSNGGGATMTTFDTPAFRATWGPDSGDVLARIGLDFADGGLTYDQYGPITAQFAETKSGTAGGYSYIGIYGFSTDPCVEFYIVDDSYSAMPIKPYSSADKGTVTIDGGSYGLYSGTMSSTDTSSCRGSTWHLFYSVRQTARTCGQISITQHFDAWKAAGMQLGNLLVVEILAEVGGGTGSIDFPIANVTIGP